MSGQPSYEIRVSPDVECNLPDPEDTNSQQPSQQQEDVPPEMIVIYDDEAPPVMGTVGPPLAPPAPGSDPEEMNLARAGSPLSASGTTSKVMCNNTHVGARTPVSFPWYGPVIVNNRAIGMLNRFLGQIMKTPTYGFN